MLAIIVLVPVLALLLLGLASLRSGADQTQTLHKIKFTATALRQNVMEQIYNNSSWQVTAAGNACMLYGTGCAPGAGGPLVLRSSDNTVFVDSTDPGDGYSLSSNRCGAFTATGNDACPFKYMLNWSAVNCVAGKCDIRVLGTFSFRPLSDTLRVPLNPANFDFDLTRNKEAESLQAGCTSLGGVFDQVTLRCNAAPERATVCPDGQMIQTIVEGQIPSCEAALTTIFPCPAGTAARGITATGALECETP